ncbi:MAG: glycerophosphodiester phosphodiesterase, partial [Anaerolineae bacterium]
CPAWGAGDWGLGNLGDEVLLLDGRNQAVDVVVYGAGIYPGVVAHPGGIASSHSLQRQPAWQDSDDCRVDFRDWPYPSPGSLP